MPHPVELLAGGYIQQYWVVWP